MGKRKREETKEEKKMKEEEGEEERNSEENQNPQERDEVIEFWKQKEKEKRERKSAANRLKRERNSKKVITTTHAVENSESSTPQIPSTPKPPNSLCNSVQENPTDFLISYLFRCKTLHVPTSSSSFYRNKVSYTLRPPFFSISPLACPEINEFRTYSFSHFSTSLSLLFFIFYNFFHFLELLL